MLSRMDAAAIAAVVVILISAGASFFFALAETALFSLSKWQMRQLTEREPRFGQVISRLLAEPQDLLATMVLGNTFATAAMLAIGFWMALRTHWPVVYTILGLFVLILFGCEVLPKTLAVRSPEDWALRVSRPLLFLEKLALAASPDRAKNQRPAALRPARNGSDPKPRSRTRNTRNCSNSPISKARSANRRRKSSCKSSTSTAAP